MMMVNNNISKRMTVACLCLVLAGLGCDEDRPPAKPVPWGPGGQGRGQVKLVLTQMGDGVPLSLDVFASVTLIRYRQEVSEQGSRTQRWPGDTSGQTQYVETGQWEVSLCDFPDGQIALEPGTYRFKHNSAGGNPPSGFYGESDIFEVKVGDEIVVPVLLNAAI